MFGLHDHEWRYFRGVRPLAEKGAAVELRLVSTILSHQGSIQDLELVGVWVMSPTRIFKFELSESGLVVF